MTNLEEIRNSIMQEMYEEAEPGLDFSDLVENPDEYPDDWYSQHYLSDERQEEIFDKHVEQHDLSKREHSALVMECILNLGPSNVPPEE